MKYSVIIPLYNKAPYVAKAINSVLVQTYTDYEMVIMDDGSQDGSFDVAQKAIEGRGNCHLYRQQNEGVSMARNNAVALSKAEHLCFLDADDWWEPTFLEEMSKLIEAYPDAGIYGTNYTIVNETKRKTRVANIGVEQGFEKGYIDYCKVYAKTLAMPLWTGAVCVPRKVFDEMQGFPKGIKLGEDFLLWIQIALKYRVAFLNKPLSYYNQDVDVANRGVGKLHNPQHHMLWNLDFLSEYEKTNPEYKQLIDNLRTYELLPYYLSKEYHDAAKQELAKVDWGRQSDKMRKQYEQSLFSLRSEYRIRQLCSRGKQWLYKVLK
jgi:glycosyltransferase involved in cell wall biosynthesis